MKHALKIGCGVVIGFVILVLRRRGTKKRAVSIDMSREETFRKSVAKTEATDPAVHRPFVDGIF